MKKEWEIDLVGKVPELNKPLFIEGLPGIGNVGKIAVDFLIEELHAKKLYTFFSPKFPHSVFVTENNLIEMPKIEIYYKKFNSNSNKKDLLLLTGDIQPIDEESCYNFCAELLELIKEHNCSEIITTGGIGLANIPDNPKVYCTANDGKWYRNYLRNTSVEKNIFGVVGPIIGVSGVLLGLSQKQEIKGAALLAETFAHPMYLGIKGAQEILKVIEQKFAYGLSLKKMSKDIAEIEQEIMSKTKEWSTEMITHSLAGAKVKKKEPNYIG